jgi:hypothetical protein
VAEVQSELDHPGRKFNTHVMIREK